MTFLHRYLDWATRPGEALPGHLRARIFVVGPVLQVVGG